MKVMKTNKKHLNVSKLLTFSVCVVMFFTE